MEETLLPEVQGLNPNQKQAVLTTEGRLLILAGAGSGKTRVLTLRMAYLISSLRVPPQAILGLTFTNKAAAEMRHRMRQMVDAQAAKEVTLSTFHSFCMQILRQEIHRLGYTTKFTLWDEHDLKRMVTLIARDILKTEGEMPSLAPTLAAIYQARHQGIQGEDIATGAEWHDEFTREVYSRLLASMRAYNAVDFDTLLWLTVELFEKFPEVLEKYQERFRYIMIDEYQDTNPIQDRLALLLSAKYNNLCVVGDDDQSIYGWRGAQVKNILNFSAGTVIKLEQNYRSTNTILKAANLVIKNNAERHHKVLWSGHGEGEPIEVFHAPSEVEEAEAVVCRIVRLKEKHALKWKDIAILYRSNALSRQFELALMKHNWNDHGRWVKGIPYQIYGGTEFFERREVKDLMAYLRVVTNEKDQEALLRIINQPRRGIGEGALDLLTAYNRKHGVPLWEVLEGVTTLYSPYQELRQEVSSKALQGIESFVSLMKTAKQLFETQPLVNAMRWLIEKTDFQKAVFEEVKSDQMRSFKMENVEEFVNAIADYEQDCVKEEKNSSLHDFVTSMPLSRDWDPSRTLEGGQGDCVHLLTFHSAKGLEFPACFLVGLEDHIIPHEKSLMETGIEEERRLMYVAITRAMRFLTISMARQRKRMGQVKVSQPSRFLLEISKELMRITRWDQL